MAQHKDEDKANPPQLDTHVPPSQQSAQGPVPKPGEPVVPNPMAPPPGQPIPIPEEAQPKEDDKSKAKK